MYTYTYIHKYIYIYIHIYTLICVHICNARLLNNHPLNSQIYCEELLYQKEKYLGISITDASTDV